MNKITREEFIQQVAAMAESVYNFHERFIVPDIVDLTPKIRINEHIAFSNLGYSRQSLQLEELGEVANAINKGLLADMVNEFADVLYVAIGNMLVFQSSGLASINQVVTKNDTKQPADMKTSTSGKVIKR